MSARIPQTEFPTRAETDADRRPGTDAWFPTVPPGTDLLADLSAAMRAAREERARGK